MVKWQNWIVSLHNHCTFSGNGTPLIQILKHRLKYINTQQKLHGFWNLCKYHRQSVKLFHKGQLALLVSSVQFPVSLHHPKIRPGSQTRPGSFHRPEPNCCSIKSNIHIYCFIPKTIASTAILIFWKIFRLPKSSFPSPSLHC